MPIKRAFDIFTSFAGLIILLPLFAAATIAVWLDGGGPVLFRQTRVGKGGKPFTIYKFRTMTASDGGPLTVENDPRITRCGYYLRKYKIDELPQLLNVIKGDMSLVGPRPEVPNLFDQYPMEIKKLVRELKPGITDYASVCFSNESDLLAAATDPTITYLSNILPEKAALWLRYHREQSFVTDLRIILMTLRKILS